MANQIVLVPNRVEIQLEANGIDALPTVPAEYLVDPLGNTVLDQNGSPMIAPANFDPVEFANAVENSAVGMAGFAPNGEFDLQRSYDGLVGQGYDGFVSAFTPVASWALGYTSAAQGCSLDETLFGAGVINQYNSLISPTVSTLGIYGNNPNNAINIMNGYNAYVAANPYPTLTVYSTGFGDEIGVVTGHTGYTGPNTGYDSPSEGIGGPNALGNSQLSSGQNQPGYSALGGEDSPSERIGGPGTLNYDSAAAVNQAIANGADPYTFQQSASAPAQAPSGADPYTFQQSASAPAQAPGGVDPYTFQQSASAAAQAQSGWALPGYEGAADNGATQTQSDITVTVHSIRLARRFHEGAPRTSPTKRRPTP